MVADKTLRAAIVKRTKRHRRSYSLRVYEPVAARAPLPPLPKLKRPKKNLVPPPGQFTVGTQYNPHIVHVSVVFHRELWHAFKRAAYAQNKHGLEWLREIMRDAIDKHEVK